MGVLDVTRWPLGVLLVGAGASAAAFAFITVNLFAEAMANIAFIAEHRWLALRLGGLVQLVELSLWGLLALLTYLAFKICEVELVFRYFRRVGRVTGGMSGRRQLRFRRDEREGT